MIHREGTITVSMLPITFGLLVSHLHIKNDHFRTKILDAYTASRLAKVKTGTPLSEIPEEVKSKLIPVLESPYAAHWGLMGKLPHPNLIPDLEAFVKKMKLKKIQDPFVMNLHQSLVQFKKETKDRGYWESLPISDATCFSANRAAQSLAKITKLLLEMAWAGRPKSEDNSLSTSHHNNLMNAYIFCEVRLETQLLQEMQHVYKEYMSDYIPWALLYELCYGAEKGADLALNLTKWGWLLGWHGSSNHLFRYPTQNYSDMAGTRLFPSYPFYFDQLCRFKPNSKHERPHFTNNIRYSLVDGQPAVGTLEGYYILDRSVFGLDSLIDESAKHEIFPTCECAFKPQLTPRHNFRVWFLDLKSLYDNTMKSSIFTSPIHAKRAFHKIIKVNAVTKLPKSKEHYKDKRWPDQFSKYVSADFQPEQLRSIAKSDHVLLEDLRLLLPETYEDDFSFHEITSEYIDRAFDLLQNPQTHFKPNMCFSKTTSSGKVRIVCDENQDQKIIDKILNHLLQIIIQKINIDFFGGRLSTYLKGCSPMLRTMERFRDSISGKEIDIANLDVKSCFDSINLKHPNFLKRLKDSTNVISDLVGRGAAALTKRILASYLHDNIVFFESIAFCSTSGIKMPKEGTLPTGFVLAPSLWMTLALPAAIKTSKWVNDGKILDWDLCGDDLMLIAEHGVLNNQGRKQILEPWFDLAKDLDFRYHFFKTYKEDKKYPLSERKAAYFQFSTNEQAAHCAWAVKFPKRSIPILHGGCALARGKLIETVTSLQKSQHAVENRLHQELFKSKQCRTSLFVPAEILRRSQTPSDFVVCLGSPQEPSLIGEGQSTSNRPDDTLRRILYGARIPSGRLYFKSHHQQLSNEELTVEQIKENLPSRKFFILDRKTQAQAFNQLIRNKPVCEATIATEQLQEVREAVGRKLKYIGQEYDGLMKTLAQNPNMSERDAVQRQARLYIYRYAYFAILTSYDKENKRFPGLRPEDIQRYYLDAEEELDRYGKYPSYALINPNRLRLTVTQELFLSEKIEDTADGRYVSKIRKILEGEIPIERCLVNPYLRRLAGDIPYAIMILHRGLSRRANSLLVAMKERNASVIPTLKAYRTPTGFKLTRGDLELFDQDTYITPLRQALNCCRGLPQGLAHLEGELSTEEINHLSSDETDFLVKVQRTIGKRLKDRKLLDALNKISEGFHAQAAGEAGRRVSYRILI